MSPPADETILLTGATGMVGRELLLRMVRAPTSRVICLVRAHSHEDAEARLDHTLREMEHQPLSIEERSRISAFAGDLTLERFGLSASRWDALRNTVQRIVHGAATVAWDLSLDEVRRINVDGTRRVLELAEGAATLGTLRKFDYVSTCMVAGKRAGLVGEEELDDRFGFWNSYEQSKFEAERLVRERAHALPVSIYRLSMVVGDSRTGYTSAFKVLYWPLRMLSKGVFWVVPADPRGIVDMVPVDYVGAAIETLSADSSQRGKCFHLAAGPECASTVTEMLEMAVSALGARRPRLIAPRLYFAFVRPLLYAVSSGRRRESLRKGRVYLPYLSYHAQFDTAHARAALEPCGIRPPHVGEYFHQLVKYALSTDWGQAPAGRESGIAGRVRNFYDLDPATQRRAATRRLLRYLKDYVEPYHPFLRKLYREDHIDLGRIRTIEEFQQLPVLEKKHLRADPLMFILRPGSPGAPPLPDGYDAADLRKTTLLRYAVGAALNLPRDPSRLVRQESLRERTRRRAMLEWLPIHTHVSSGSSGEPVPVTFSHHDISTVISELANLAIKAKQPAPGYLPLEWDERKMSLFPGAPHMAFYSPLLIKILSGAPSFETFGGNVISTERQISIFVSGGFQTLIAIPSYLIHWLRTALALQKEGKVGRLKTLKRVILGAEPVSEALREHLRELAVEAGAHSGMKIIQTLGMTEMKWSFFECAERSGIHLNPRYFYWELLHPDTRQPVGPREPGVLVFTHIGWRGTVLVRYWTGDLVKGGMAWERCEMCGWTFPRIYPPICRIDQDFTKIKGALVDLSVLVEVIRDTPGIRNFQVVLENETGGPFARDHMILTVVPEPGLNEDGLRSLVVERIKRSTEVSPDRVIFELDEASLEKRLFARTTVKADYVVERRLDRQ